MPQQTKVSSECEVGARTRGWDPETWDWGRGSETGCVDLGSETGVGD